MKLRQRKDVVCIGILPPPITGAALATERMFDAIQQVHSVVTIAFSVPANANFAQRVLARVSSLMRGQWALLRSDSRSLYVALPGGYSAIVLLPILITARLRGMRRVVHHHNFGYLERRNLVYALVFRVAGRKATHVLLCETMMRKVEEQYGDYQMFHLDNLALIREPNVSVREIDEELRFKIGHLSNLSLEKGLDTVLRSYREAKAVFPACTLKLGGPVSNQSDWDLIYSYMNSVGGIEWCGFVNQDQLSSFFNDVGVFVLPSNNEAQPLVVLEAASYGVPAVTYGVGCLPDVGSATTVDEPGAFTKEILTKCTEPPRRIQLASDTAAQIRFWREELSRLVVDL